MNRTTFVSGAALLTLFSVVASTQAPADIPTDLVKPLEFRSLPTNVVTGRIQDVEIDPKNPNVWYVASAFGGLWKTDQSRHHLRADLPTTGGDASTCAASSSTRRTRTSCGSAPARTRASAARTSATASTSRPTPARRGSASGLENSEHIGKIAIDPRNSNIVWVASQGPLFSAGGERGVYKTTDGGATWTRVLHVNDDTGFTDVVFDPKNPDIVYRRHVSAPASRRPDDRRRARRRRVQDDQRRQDLDEADAAACRPAKSAASRWPSIRRSPDASTR